MDRFDGLPDSTCPMAQAPTPSQTPLAEISHGPSAFEQFLENNQKALLAGLLVAILGVVVVVVYRGVEDGQRMAASNALYAASDVKALEKLIKEQSGSGFPSATTARLLLAQRHADDGLVAESIQTLRDLLAENPAHVAAPAAKASLAAKLMNQGDAAEASTLFRELTDDPDSAYLAPYALLCLGDIAVASGDVEKGRAIYQEAIDAYPSSTIISRFNQRISGLEAQMPEEVAPAPTPAPEIKSPADLPSIPTPLLLGNPDGVSDGNPAGSDVATDSTGDVEKNSKTE